MRRGTQRRPIGFYKKILNVLRQLQCQFKATLGHTVMRELQHTRIDRVKKLLSQTDFPLAQIAELSGLANEFYLGKSFKKLVGQSPSSYRQNYLMR